MTDARRRRPVTAALWLVTIGALLALGLAYGDFRQLIAEALGKVRPATVLATLPGQALAMLLCAAALRALRPGVTYWGCLAARLLRDAGDNLLVFFPGLGDVIGARALVLAGGRSRAAVSASVIDKFAETVAQLPFIALAAYVLLQHWDGGLAISSGFHPSMEAVGIALGILVILLVVVGALAKATEGLSGRLVARVREEYRLLVAEFHEQRTGTPMAIVLHLVAWLMGGLQIWMAAHTMGLEPSLYEAIAMESAAYALRMILFFVPAGLATQEAGLVAAGLVFGISAPQSLALGLALRLRDVVFGVPLLVWPALELRHRRKATGRSAH